MKRRNGVLSLCAILALLTGAACGPQRREAPVWKHRVLLEGKNQVRGLAAGDIDPDVPGLEIVSVDAEGTVIAFFDAGSKGKKEVLYEHGTGMESLLVADVDPTAPGTEAYAGGCDEGEKGGAVVQIVRRGGKTAVKRIWTGRVPVSSMARLEPEEDSKTPELVITTVTGEVLVLHPVGGDGKWLSKAIHTEPDSEGEEGVRIDDVLAGPVCGCPPRSIFLVTRSGRAVLIDADKPQGALEVHREEGGISRAVMDPRGDVVVACTNGRVLRLAKKGEEWTWSELYLDEDEPGGLASGKFTLASGGVELAIFGHNKKVSALERAPGLWKPAVLFADTHKGHCLAAADLVEGNGSDELVLGGESGRVILLYRE